MHNVYNKNVSTFRRRNHVSKDISLVVLHGHRNYSIDTPLKYTVNFKKKYCAFLRHQQLSDTQQQASYVPMGQTAVFYIVCGEHELEQDRAIRRLLYGFCSTREHVGGEWCEIQTCEHVCSVCTGKIVVRHS